MLKSVLYFYGIFSWWCVVGFFFDANKCAVAQRMLKPPPPRKPLYYLCLWCRCAAAGGPGGRRHLHPRHRLRVGPGTGLRHLRQEEDMAFSGWANHSVVLLQSGRRIVPVCVCNSTAAVSDTHRKYVMTRMWLSADVLSALAVFGKGRLWTLVPVCMFYGSHSTGNVGKGLWRCDNPGKPMEKASQWRIFKKIFLPAFNCEFIGQWSARQAASLAGLVVFNQLWESNLMQMCFSQTEEAKLR